MRARGSEAAISLRVLATALLVACFSPRSGLAAAKPPRIRGRASAEPVGAVEPSVKQKQPTSGTKGTTNDKRRELHALPYAHRHYPRPGGGGSGGHHGPSPPLPPQGQGQTTGYTYQNGRYVKYYKRPVPAPTTQKNNNRNTRMPSHGRRRPTQRPSRRPSTPRSQRPTTAPDRPVEPTRCSSLVEVVCFDPELRMTLACGLLREYNLEDRLSSSGSVTFFAPTDEAFARLGDEHPDVFDTVLPGVDESILLYHLANGGFSLSDLECTGLVPTLLEGRSSRTKCVGDDRFQRGPGNGTGGSAGEGLPRIIDPDLPACGGSLVHVVDHVLLPRLPAAATATGNEPPVGGGTEERATGGPTVEPTAGASPVPTLRPTLLPTRRPSTEPTAAARTPEPTTPHTTTPSTAKTAGPTSQPTSEPTTTAKTSGPTTTPRTSEPSIPAVAERPAPGDRPLPATATPDPVAQDAGTQFPTQAWTSFGTWGPTTTPFPTYWGTWGPTSTPFPTYVWDGA